MKNIRKSYRKRISRDQAKSRQITALLKRGSAEGIGALKAGDTVLLSDLQAAHEHMIDMLKDLK